MSLPRRCDVAVLGGGLAGLLAADRLVRAGASVVRFAGPTAPVPATERSLGIVGLGWIDSPWRLTQGLGEDVARGLLAWSSLARESLSQTCDELGVPMQRTGSWRASIDEEEAREWRESSALLQAWGLSESRIASPEELLGLGRDFVAAVQIPEDGLVDVTGLVAALSARFHRAGGQTVSEVGELDELDGAPLVRWGSGTLSCELAVVAGGAMSRTAHRFFESTVYPVRLQGQRVTAPPGLSAAAPVIARHRFEAWCKEPDGRLAFVGCRWGEQPEMEAGVSDDAVCSERVSLRQDEFLHKHLGVPRDTSRERWTGIVAYTCDGLPLVGPLPGAPKVLALTGWSGWGLALMARAVDEVTAAMMGEPSPGGAGTPGWLTARRLI